MRRWFSWPMLILALALLSVPALYVASRIWPGAAVDRSTAPYVASRSRPTHPRRTCGLGRPGVEQVGRRVAAEEGLEDRLGPRAQIDGAVLAVVFGLVAGGAIDPDRPAHRDVDGADIFLQKYNPNGDVLWSCQHGGIGNDWTRGAAIGPDGNIYVTGGTMNDLSGPSAGGEGACLLTFNQAGDRGGPVRTVSGRTRPGTCA